MRVSVIFLKFICQVNSRTRSKWWFHLIMIIIEISIWAKIKIMYSKFTYPIYAEFYGVCRDWHTVSLFLCTTVFIWEAFLVMKKISWSVCLPRLRSKELNWLWLPPFQCDLNFNLKLEAHREIIYHLSYSLELKKTD